MRRRLSKEAKQAVIIKAKNRKSGITLKDVAKANNVGYSTLQKWLNSYVDDRQTSQSSQLSCKTRFQHVLEAAKLDETALGAYCRSNGLYRQQITQWQEEFMAEKDKKVASQEQTELKRLKAENKRLEKELRRKEKALAEASALLILKKKADLLWGDNEDD